MKKKVWLLLGLCDLVAISTSYLIGTKASKDNNSAVAKSTKSHKSNIEHAQSSQQAKVTHENPIASKKHTHFGFFKTGLPQYKSVHIHGHTISGKQIARAAGTLDDATLSNWDLAMIVYLANQQHINLAQAKKLYFE